MADPEETKAGSEAKQRVRACMTEQLPVHSRSRHPAQAPGAIALCNTAVSLC